MPTKPVPEILTRSIDNPELAEVLQKFSAAIEETVNFGTHVLKWCAEAGEGGDDQLPLLLSFRRGLEILDSISILLGQSSIDPCKALLRALLEVLLGTEYMLQADTKRRAMSFMVWFFHDKLRWYRKLDPDTPDAKQFRSRLRKDRLGRRMEPPSLPDLRGIIENAEAALKQAEYLEAEKEYERLRSSGVRNPTWYSLFDGPRYVEQLAERVELPAVYEILYRAWSSMVHGTDVIDRKMSVGPSGRLQIYQIRLPTDAQTVTSTALSMAFELYRSYVRRYVPDRDRDFNDWYCREIRPVFTALSGNQFIQVV